MQPDNSVSQVAPPTPNASRTISASARVHLAILIALGAVLVAMRIRAFPLPLERDGGNYAYIGARLLAGDWLYVDVWDHQPPGVFWLFAATIACFGDEPIVFRVLATVFSLVSLSFVYLLLLRLGSRWAAAAGGLLFALCSADPGTGGEGCNREIYMTPLILGAWYAAATGPAVAPPARRAFFSGLLLGLASLLKTVVAVPWLLLGLWMAWTIRRDLRGRERIQRIGWVLSSFALGPTCIWLGVGAYFFGTGRFGEFVDAVFLFNLEYAETGAGLFERFTVVFRPQLFREVFPSAAGLWMGAVAGTVLLVRDVFAFSRSSSLAVLSLGLAAYLAACLPGQPWPHYYYLTLAPAAVVAALGLERLSSASAAGVERTGRVEACDAVPHATVAQAKARGSRQDSEPWRRGQAACVAAIAIAALLCGAVLVTQYRHYLGVPLPEITQARYKGRDFWARDVGRKVAQVTEPDDTIFVYGHDASIYYYARRRCASRYTMITALASRYSDHPRRRRIMLDDLARNRPRVVLVLGEPFPEWVAFLHERYDAVGGDFRDDGSGKLVMMVLADRNRPMKAIRQMDWDWRGPAESKTR